MNARSLLKIAIALLASRLAVPLGLVGLAGVADGACPPVERHVLMNIPSPEAAPPSSSSPSSPFVAGPAGAGGPALQRALALPPLRLAMTDAPADGGATSARRIGASPSPHRPLAPTASISPPSLSPSPGATASLAPSPAPESETATPTPTPIASEERRFRIGYHARTSQAALSSAFFEQLALFMEQRPETQAALADAGYRSGRVVALRAEDHFDLIQRMNQEEFDMVFCSAVAFVQQTGGYVAFLQTYNPGRGDVEIPGKGPRRWGMAVASRAHPLFAPESEAPDEAAMRRFIAEARMAVVSNHSAAGYLYPTIELMKQYGVRPRELIFCDSSDEVARFVINGLVDLGALDEKALEDVVALIPGDPSMDSLVATVARASVPTDPVVILPALTPPGSRLSPALARAIRLYCGQLADSPLTVVDIQTSPYREVGEAIAELHRRSAQSPSTDVAPGETP